MQQPQWALAVFAAEAVPQALQQAWAQPESQQVQAAGGAGVRTGVAARVAVRRSILNMDDSIRLVEVGEREARLPAVPSQIRQTLNQARAGRSGLTVSMLMGSTGAD